MYKNLMDCFFNSHNMENKSKFFNAEIKISNHMIQLIFLTTTGTIHAWLSFVFFSWEVTSAWKPSLDAQ